MCGIVGYTNSNNDNKIIKKMADKIKHRGPDGEGFYIDNYIALGHRRLSIIDLSTGNQPMFNEDKSLVVIFNGEIYNYIELSSDLKKLGHKFSTKSDTEVLLHGYEEFGYDFVKKLRGMFAYAIYDINKEELFIVRDNFGIKPMYYYHNDKTFMFASEIKCFLEHPDFKKVFNKSLLGPYLSFGFTPTKETFFKGVYRLDPGTYLIYKNNKITEKRYFKIEFKENKLSYEESVKKISEIMKESVNRHLISDVEVGSFLSSGIDSSYIVSLAKPDNTYTVGYENKKYDETSYAKDLTNKLNLKNTSKIISKEEYMNILPKIMYFMDEPTSDPATVALYFVASLARKDLKVVLSGEGADEFFGGYNTYREVVDMSFYNKIPYFIRHGISLFCSILPEIRGINFLVRRGKKLEDYYIGVGSVYSEKESNKALRNKRTIKNKDITKDVFNEYKDESNLIKMQAIDINFWLIKDILQKADRMTMAASVEGRVPFIDKEVFKVASSLPFDYKVTKENTKVALREASREVIPNESYKKKKLGFPVPVRDWIKESDFYNNIEESFNSEYAKKYFNVKYINKLLIEHKENKKDNYKKIWTIYMFLVWYKEYFGNE